MQGITKFDPFIDAEVFQLPYVASGLSLWGCTGKRDDPLALEQSLGQSLDPCLCGGSVASYQERGLGNRAPGFAPPSPHWLSRSVIYLKVPQFPHQ